MRERVTNTEKRAKSPAMISFDIGKYSTRKVPDFHLWCHDAVFLHFKYTEDKRIYLNRISFDGYGACMIGNNAKCLDSQSSKYFTDAMRKGNIDQEKITEFALESIQLNKDHICVFYKDALVEYGLIQLENNDKANK